MYESIIDGIWWIPGRDKFLPDSHMYVVGKPGGGDFTLIECGMIGMADYKLQVIEEIGINKLEISRIILTHTHIDHIGCLPELKKVLPNVQVWVHEAEATPLEVGDESIVFGGPMFESIVRSQYTVDNGYFKTEIGRKLHDGDVVDLGGIEFRIVHIPGHSAGSIGLFNEEHRLFMSGDTIYADGAIGRYDLVSADPEQLKTSLEKIANLGIDILLPCHNRVVKRGAENMVEQTARQWIDFLSD